jgi:DNA-binding Lrp family transcriptional regulator
MNNTRETILQIIQDNSNLTLQEIGDQVGHAKSVVLYHVRNLAGAGLIVYTPGQHRSIKIQEK